MFRKRYALALFAIVLAVPGVARASGDWPWPVSGGVALGYGQTYADAQGRTCTHGGVDITADSGSGVRASASGQVTFAGLVPAGAGNQAYAVTVLTQDGLRVTYMPLRSVTVRKGEDVSAGEGVGSLAESGDASSPGAHLHLGVRRGDTQLDPMTFLGAAAGSSAPAAPKVPPAGAGKTSAPAQPVAKASQSAPSSVRAPVTSPGAATAPAVSGASASAPSKASALHDALRQAGRSGSGAFARVPVLTRVRKVADTPQLKVSSMLADLRAGRGAVTAWAVRLGLLLAAGGCALPVWKGVRAAADRASAAAAPAAVARQDRR